MNRREKAAQNRDKASRLNKTYSIGAAQARYRETGNWYATLTRFPAALFDARGYILFPTEEAYRTPSPHIHIGKQISVPKGISALPGYVPFPDTGASPTATDAASTLTEGTSFSIIVTAYERNPIARQRCIQHYGCACVICGFSFASEFGEAASGYIHVHHIELVSSRGGTHEVDPIKDLRPVCPNCHAVIHLRQRPYSIAEVKRMRRRT